MLLQKLSGPVAVNEQNGNSMLIEELKNLPNPPLIELTQEDIHIRRCRLAGDAVDHQMGCFRTHDLEKLLSMTQGAPALIGHDRQSIAGLRASSAGQSKSTRVIAISYRASTGPRLIPRLKIFACCWTAVLLLKLRLPLPSVNLLVRSAGKDIRDCEHQPGTHYGLKLCHYYYDGLERVLEGSFVYRGAEPGTGILSEISDLNAAIKGRKRITIQFGGRTYEAIAPLNREDEHASAA